MICMRRTSLLISVAALAGLAGACVGAEKSANPLAPTVAGPIPGVNISTPNPLQPMNVRVPVDQQPVTLTVGNATTNGQRPLTYSYQVATDAGFTNLVFTRDGVAPDPSGQTALRLPDPLATAHTYYWHAKALDGANTSVYSGAASFDVYTPIVIQAPVLVSPTNNVTTDSSFPTFTFNDAVHSGPVGTISYVIEVADSDAFANKLAVWTIGETPNQTSLAAPGALPSSKQLFWHVRASDPTTVGPFSTVAVFNTPAPVVVAPPAGGGGGGGGGTNLGNALDQINLSQAAVYGGSPADVASWPVTTKITAISMGGCNIGQAFAFDAQNTWPDYTDANGLGPLQYTVWAVVNQGGQWNTSGIVQMWRGRPSTGAPIMPASCGWDNWAYGGRWGPMGSYNPQAGDQVGFFVTAGNARGVGTVTSVRERSNVVLVTLPDSGFVSY
jgi:hypothetical protein